jgi:hypothetical protein
MRASKRELPTLFRAGEATIRAKDMGDQRCLIVSLPGGTDVTPLLRGLPGDLSPCPHWGYVLSGRLDVRYADGRESFAPGDLFYMPPGHTVATEVDTEFVEFSPPEAYDEVLQFLRRNLAAAGAG